MTTRNIVPRANNEGGVGTTSKKWANVWGVLVNALTLSAQTIGFTIAGGTTSKTLTVPLDASVSGTNTGDQTGGTPALTLGTANTAGTSTNFIRRDDTILAFDATNPAALGTVGPGSATVAARRDHVHSSTSVSLITPALGTPTAGILTACTTATAADNTATTALASTAFAKSQDAVLARLPDQAVNMTAAASGSNGIAVADNDNIDFGTGNFTLVWRGSLPDWTPTVGLAVMYKWPPGYLLIVETTGAISMYLYQSTAFHPISSVIPVAIDGTVHEIAAVVTTGAVTRTVDFYFDGVPLGTQQTVATINTLDNSNALYILGTNTTRNAGICSFAATYNRALTAAEVLDFYRNGIAFGDKWGSRTSLVTGDNSTFASDTGWWSITGSITGGVYVGTAVVSGGGFFGRNLLCLPYKKYRVNYTVVGYSSGGVYPRIGTGADTVTGAVRNANGTYSDEITNLAGTVFGFIASGISTLNIDDVTIYEIGATIALEPGGIQPSPGQWLDSSSNKLHALQPATGSSLTRFKDTFEIKWTNTWAGDHTAQYIGGINQSILPVGCYIDSIIGVITGATIEDIILGDGSDTDRWVTITTGLAAGTKSFTIASPISDGTNYKLVVDPDANFTGSIAWTITGRIL